MAMNRLHGAFFAEVQAGAKGMSAADPLAAAMRLLPADARGAVELALETRLIVTYVGSRLLYARP